MKIRKEKGRVRGEKIREYRREGMLDRVQKVEWVRLEDEKWNRDGNERWDRAGLIRK